MLSFLLATFFAMENGTGIAPPFELVRQREVSTVIRGAALGQGGEFYTWGERLERWPMGSLRAKTLGRFETKEGGCLADLNQDGQLDVVAPTAAGLAVFAAPRWQRTIIDAEADAFECVMTTLLGHRGLLVVHRGMQVRFYEKPAAPGGRWPYREIYSFYTASHQGGLLLHDVDGDQRLDIFCGNYWIQSPAEFELPWRLYAINTWSEQPLSAAARLAVMGKRLLWAESRLSPARLAVFHQPEDPKVLWEPTLLELARKPLAFPRGVASWRDEFFLVGEDNGAASRLIVYTARGEARVLERGHAIQHVLPVEGGFAAIGPRRVAVYRRPAGRN